MVNGSGGRGILASNAAVAGVITSDYSPEGTAGMADTGCL